MQGPHVYFTGFPTSIMEYLKLFGAHNDSKLNWGMYFEFMGALNLQISVIAGSHTR